MYARIVVAAEEVIKHREHLEQSAHDLMAITAAAEHGVETQDPTKAAQVYAEARVAQQQIYASAKALSVKLARFEDVLKERYKLLPGSVAGRFPIERVLEAGRLIHEFAAASKPAPSNILKFKVAQSEVSLTKEGHTFLWWRRFIEKYDGQWSDMYHLSVCWRLTDAKDLCTFQRRVRKLKPIKDSLGMTWILGCPPWALP
jgi:hypothetical protein